MILRHGDESTYLFIYLKFCGEKIKCVEGKKEEDKEEKWRFFNIFLTHMSIQKLIFLKV